MTNQDVEPGKPFANEAEQTRSLLIGGAFAKQATASRRLNVSEAQMSRVLGGTRRPSKEMLHSWDIELSNLSQAGTADNPEFQYEAGMIQRIWGFDVAGAPPKDTTARSTATSTPTRSNPTWWQDVRARSWWFVVAAVALIAVAGAFGLLRQQGDADSGGGSNTTVLGLDGETAACPMHFVDFVDGFQAAFEPSSAVMVGAVVKSRTNYNWPCPVEPGRAFFGGSLVMTPLVDRDDKQSFLVSTSPTEAVVLSLEQWLSVVEASTWAAVLEVDLPLPKRYEPAAIDSVLIASGGWRFVGSTLNERHVLLPPAIYDAWRSGGGTLSSLGPPVSNGYLVDTDLRFDFAGGYLQISLAELDLPRAKVATVADKTKGLPSPLSRPDLVVIQDGSTWLRDGPSRYWIPYPSLRSCLANQYMEPVEGTGTALARIQYHGIAECEVLAS